MLVTNVGQIQRFTSMRGASIPDSIHDLLHHADGGGNAVPAQRQL